MLLVLTNVGGRESDIKAQIEKAAEIAANSMLIEYNKTVISQLILVHRDSTSPQQRLVFHVQRYFQRRIDYR